ncbi:hypothetical protein [Zavarzinella formosa]|nr:hypothetical protein [Zavarzinella formosa]
MSIDDDGGGLFGCRPILCVESVARSIEYYVRRLGLARAAAQDNDDGGV